MKAKSSDNNNMEPSDLRGSHYGSLDVTTNETLSPSQIASDSITPTRTIPPKPAVRQRTSAFLKQQQQQQSTNFELNSQQAITLPSTSVDNNQKQKEAFKRELEFKLEKELNKAHKSLKQTSGINKRHNFTIINSENDNDNDNKKEVISDDVETNIFEPLDRDKKPMQQTTSVVIASDDNIQDQIEPHILPPKDGQIINNTSISRRTGDQVMKPQAVTTVRPYPKKVLFIIANEFCERFSYYGLRTVLVLYLKNVLGFSDANSTISFHLFASLCYLTPLLGAILADSLWGKYNTIVYLSIVYFFGELFLVISSIFWNHGFVSITYTFIGLFMIGVGTGGIKPCVGALGGDQFQSNEGSWRQSFFSLFYAAINIGSLLSMFATPMLRSHFKCVDREDCYPLAFGVPCLLMLIAIVIFVSAKNYYTLNPLPEQNVIVSFCQCIWLALRRRFSPSYKGGSIENVDNLLPWPLDSKQHQPKQLLTKITSTPSSSSSISDLSDESNTIKANYYNSFNQQTAAAAAKESTLMGKGAKQFSSRHSSSTALIGDVRANNADLLTRNKRKNKHWLYLASDRFDIKTINEFKSVLDLLVIALPFPVYWCLFDQQSSLWTLQANRMDGRIFNTNFILQPDQLSVANPVLLLMSIPLFELFIYPSLARCNLLTKPLQRITSGGLLAALTFVISSLIELNIQKYSPPIMANLGETNLIFVNGLSECSIFDPMISNISMSSPLSSNALYEASKISIVNSNLSNIHGNMSNILKQFDTSHKVGNKTTIFQYEHQVETIPPLSFKSVTVKSTKQKELNSYRFKFKLSSANPNISNNNNHELLNYSLPMMSVAINNCPFDSNKQLELNIGPLEDQSVKFLYLEQGNGKLNYKLFNESLELPDTGKARVRLIYESFGSSLQAEKRTFYLERIDSFVKSINNNNNNQTIKSENQFKISHRDGQVSISDYLDIDVPSSGEFFRFKTSDSNLKISFSNNINNNNLFDNKQSVIFLETGTRNLIVAHQKNATHVEVNYQVLQDNKYRISMLYQLIPYLLISMSEVMFSITGLQFSYAMAPENMKSIVLGTWSLSTAFGNLLTVLVESLHLFSNIAYDFLFYATIMALDMLLLAILAYYYKPYKAQETETNKTIETKTHTPEVS